MTLKARSKENKPDYVPAKTMPAPIVSLFHATPDLIRTVPGLGTRLRYMGIRHVELSVLLTGEIPWCKDNGYRAILIGDAIMRTPGDWARSMHEPIITKAAKVWGESGICDGIEMVDETKQDPAMYAPHAANFVKWWRSACSIPIAWPSLMPRLWSNPKLSNNDSPQIRWDTPGITGKERVERVERSLVGYPHEGRELGALTVLSFWYEKRSHGAYYNPRKDKLITSIPTVQNFRRQCRAALDAGATRLRIYDLDPPYRRLEREQAPLGAPCQQGTGLWDRRWPGLEMAVREVMENR